MVGGTFLASVCHGGRLRRLHYLFLLQSPDFEPGARWRMVICERQCSAFFGALSAGCLAGASARNEHQLNERSLICRFLTKRFCCAFSSGRATATSIGLCTRP